MFLEMLRSVFKNSSSICLQGIVSTEHDVIVPMDNLLHKHLDRLLEDKDIEAQIQRLSALNGGPLKMKFLFKYGYDGSSGTVYTVGQ